MLKLNCLCSNFLRSQVFSANYASLICLNPLLKASFSKWTKPQKLIKSRDTKSSIAASDEKGAKLAKEEEAAQKKKKIEAEKKRIEKSKIKKTPMRTFDMQFDVSTNQATIDQSAVDRAMQTQGIRASIMLQDRIRRKNELKKAQAAKHFLRPFFDKINKVKKKQAWPLQEFFKTPNQAEAREPARLKRKTVQKYFNTEPFVNQQFKVKSITNPPDDAKRTGVIAKKIGMTATWDKWGRRIALTVLQIDRCQVVQLKTKEKDGYDALQLGAGQKNLKKLKKPEIGHYLKNNIPPKEVLFEFHVSKENVLPEGFQLGPRHFVPGQLVDVIGTSKGKGFQGTVKRWHFKTQPATHGNSLSHRVLGSTGNRTDPGKVFKNKKMPGRMGNRRQTLLNLKVYKIEYDKSLVYVMGAVPGKNGNWVRIRDALHKPDVNEEFLNHPTFIPQKNKEFATEVIMEPPEEDPQEIYDHENIHVKEDDKADASATTTTTTGAPA